MRNSTANAADYLSRLTNLIKLLDPEEIDAAINQIEKAWRAGKQIITLGNGGSALTALHFINDWSKSIFLATGIPFYGRSLCDNIGVVMAYSNDLSYEDVFVEQLKNVMRPGDLVVAISGSGNSENVLRAVDWANTNAGVTLGLCGYNGGKLKDLAQQTVWVNINDMQISEDVHFFFGHIVMQKLCGTHM